MGGSSGRVVAAVGKTSLEKGMKAGNIVKGASKVLGGGGKPELAQDGGPEAEKLDEALEVGLATIKPSIKISG